MLFLVQATSDSSMQLSVLKMQPNWKIKDFCPMALKTEHLKKFNPPPQKKPTKKINSPQGYLHTQNDSHIETAELFSTSSSDRNS